MLGAFPSFGEALWSSIAHLVDPGSIGDDDTPAERTVGLVQVIAGMVFFAGVVLTVLSEVVDRALRSLRSGDPSVRRSGHLLIVGFNQSLSAVQTLLRENFGSRPPEIVVMLPVDQAERRDDARRALSGYPVRASVVVADPDADGYARVCADRARSIVILSPEGEPDAADVEATDRAVLLAGFLAEPGSGSPPVAVQMRRARNTRALWYTGLSGSGTPLSRFPDTFDALVNDRNIGALLSLAVTNPAFAEVFVGGGPDPVGPSLTPVGNLAGLTFAEARERRVEDVLVGILRGEGPAAEATYLPPGDTRLDPAERLIVLPADVPADPRGFPAGGAKVQAAAPVPVLLIGWSDATLAMIEDLHDAGVDLGQIHLLDLPETRPGSITLIEGDPADPDAIARAISRVGPEIVWVAAREGGEPEALITAMLARQSSRALILVEESSTDPQQNSRVATGLVTVSTSAMVAENVALSLLDPALIVARETMTSDPGLALQTLVYTGPDPLPPAALQSALGSQIAALTDSRPEANSAPLTAGDRILALTRLNEG